MSAQLVIPAAGMGRRLGARMPKALVKLCGRNLIARALDRLLAVEFDEPIIVIIPPGYEKEFTEALSDIPAVVSLVEGGDERQHSVRNGLAVLRDDTDIVVIHDAARPFPPVRAVCIAIEAARRYGAATLATPATDTILIGDGDGFLDSTPERKRVWACQTPQVFQTDIIRRAHERAKNGKGGFTDDATLAHEAGCRVKLVDGGMINIKITTKRELAFASFLLEQGLV
ncbi:MAG TPA: 2-C-methyl-D-erythritol 4-phosphate cytidylyltransferase [Candidatus Hydrogenedentes bacterium]|nr:2-C-methyl-D-erythritol 4-phosphate cytidylyltransferase [Candidatus Hydrogenedentota bacterium]